MAKNFGGLPAEFSSYQSARIAVLPIPFDHSVSWQKGAAQGPAAIIDASGQVELYDIETDSEVYKKGIFTTKPVIANDPKSMLKKGHAQTLALLKDHKFVVTLGGDHSIALAPIMAHRDHFGDFTVLHLDAHADMRDSYEGNKYSHASVMARVKELGLDVVSLGIRSMEVTEKSSWQKGNLFLAADIFKMDEQEWIGAVIKRLRKKVYISFDVDVFDSSLMSSTGTPEPGGLGWYQIMSLLRAVCQATEVIGCDFVELAPCRYNKAPDFLVAKLIYKFLSYL